MGFLASRLRPVIARLGPGVGITLGCIAVVIIGLQQGWWARAAYALGGWFWWGLILLLLAGLFVLLQWYLPRYREKRFLARLRSEDAKTPVDEGAERQQQLRESFLAALRTLNNSPALQQQEGLPLYALPWYVLMGESQSGKTALLRSVANTFSPFVRPGLGSITSLQDCEWDFFNSAIILDTTGCYAFPAQPERDLPRWHRFLALLRHYRSLQPINGVIIAVAADGLMARDQARLRLDAEELRQRLAEVGRELEVDCPVYLLVTRCDLIEGFTEFFACVPEHILRQAFGYVHAAPLQTGEQRPSQVELRFDAVYGAMVERLQQLRLAIFNEPKLPPATLRQKIFCFPEEFRALQQPLSIFLETLCATNPYQHTPFFRGLFFCSAQQQGTPVSLLRRQFRLDGQSSVLQKGTQGYFLHDFFAEVLPRDQYLARPSGRARRRGLLRHLFSAAGCVMLCVLLVLWLTRAFRSDRRTHAVVDAAPCTATVASPPDAPLLAQAERCRQVAQRLAEHNRQRSWPGKVLFNRSGRLESQLRRQFVDKFAAEVLAPLDARLLQRLSVGTDTMPLVFLLIKRIELLTRCLSLSGCPEPMPQEMRLDYALLLDPIGQRVFATEQAALLQQEYETYLHWAVPEVLHQEQALQAERLRHWFAAKQFAPQQILLWANQHYAAVTLQQYWQGAPPVAGQPAVQVEGAYTPGAWQQSIQPFLRRAAAAVSDMEALLKDFEAAYRAQYFAQWQRFLADFPRGELPWWGTREQRRQLAVRLLEPHSPYNRIVDDVFTNVAPLLPPMLVVGMPSAESGKGTPTGTSVVQKAWHIVDQLQEKIGLGDGQETVLAGAEADIPGWVRVLRRFIRSESRQLYLAALRQVGERLASHTAREQSFKLAQGGFAEANPTEKSTHPILQARWVIQDFRQQTAAADASEEVFWPLLERPILFAWKVVLEEASGFLQKSWAENVVAPAQGLSKIEQAVLLYGPQGKVREFVEQFLTPFLVENESRLGQVLQEELPLSPTFMTVLRDEKQLRPILASGSDASYRVRVETTRDAFINSDTNIVEEKTELTLECAASPFKLSNRPKTPTGHATTVFWSFTTCSDAVITLFVSCNRACVERATAVGMAVSEESALPLVKRYTGQTGFLHFLQDFSDGAQEFREADFADPEATLRRYGIHAVRVFYQVDVPPTLKKIQSFLSGPIIIPSITK
jgi:type VI secretion system protein ImpL